MISPIFSFIQFNNCELQENPCEKTDVFLHGFAGGDVIVTQLIGKSNFAIDLETLDGFLVQSDIATFQDLDFNTMAIINVPDIEIGCYRLKLKETRSVFCDLSLNDICDLSLNDICNLGTYVYEIGCFYFKIIKDLCYTKVVTYNNNETGQSFDYSQGYANKIRLPIKYDFPQNITKSEYYRTSGGSIIRLSSNTKKEYELETDYANEHFHDCMNVLIYSDFIDIDGKNFIGNEYAPNWVKENGSIKLAKGKGKIILTPYDNQNPKF